MTQIVLTATALITSNNRGLLLRLLGAFRPDGTREDSTGQRGGGGRVNWNCRGRLLNNDGGKTLRRNADELPIGPIVRMRIDHVIVLEGRKHGRFRDHGIVLETDIIVFKVQGNIAMGGIEVRRVIRSRSTYERVFSVARGNVLGETRHRA